MEANSYQSSYIIKRDPYFYGGKQEEYVSLAEKAIDFGLKTIIDERKNNTDPALIYHKVTQVLQKARHDIAMQHQPEKADFFGIRRDDKNKPKGNFANSYTPLSGVQYEEYNAKFMDRLIKTLNKIPHDLKTFSKKSITVNETILNMKCSFEAELMEVKDVVERKYTAYPTIEELSIALGIKNKTLDEIIEDYSLMKKLKAEHKDLHERIMMSCMMIQVNVNYPSPSDLNPIDVTRIIRRERKNFFVMGTLRLELEKGKMFCISKRLTWLYQDWDQDPVERMRKHSNAYIIHQDTFLIERTENACAQIFADAINWDKNTSTLDTLKEKVALLRFVYGNCMPCHRGDGAIGDWLELDIYRYHGFKNTKHNAAVLPCFELLATTRISEYLTDYKNTITVQ